MTSPLIPDQAGAADALDQGQVLLLNTDTLPGLHARLDRPAALAALATLKGRADDKPLLVLAASDAEALGLAAPVDARWSRLLAACWPGPFTFILAAGEGLPRAVRSATETVAIRVPDRGPLQRLLARTGPLASTSANLAGQDPATSLETARARFSGLAAWDDGAPAPAGAASALVALLDDGPRVLRPGPRPLPRFASDA